MTVVNAENLEIGNVVMEASWNVLALNSAKSCFTVTSVKVYYQPQLCEYFCIVRGVNNRTGKERQLHGDTFELVNG